MNDPLFIKQPFRSSRKQEFRKHRNERNQMTGSVHKEGWRSANVLSRRRIQNQIHIQKVETPIEQSDHGLNDQNKSIQSNFES